MLVLILLLIVILICVELSIANVLKAILFKLLFKCLLTSQKAVGDHFDYFKSHVVNFKRLILGDFGLFNFPGCFSLLSGECFESPLTLASFKNRFKDKVNHHYEGKSRDRERERERKRERE